MHAVLARVDNRLVHGQMLEAWVPALGADTILVVDRALASQPLQRAIIEALSHPGLQVRLMEPMAAAEFLKAEGKRRKIIVLFSGISGAIEALDEGVSFGRLNLGNIHPREGSRPLTASVHLTREDVKQLSRLVARGVEVEARAVPGDRSPSVSAWLVSAETE